MVLPVRTSCLEGVGGDNVDGDGPGGRGAGAGRGQSYDFITPTAMLAMTLTTIARVMNANKHLIAHFLSVFLRHSISSFLSASVLVGSQFSGALSGDSKVMIPASQNIGKTGRG